MRRKNKVEVLEAMIHSLEKSGKEKRCFKCKILFEKWMGKWGGRVFGHSYCIVCHAEICGMRRKNFLLERERKEFTRVRKLKEGTEKLE